MNLTDDRPLSSWEKGIAGILLLSVLVVSFKMVVCGFTIDDAYHIAMSYRNALGDRLFLEMWEPHQTSAFLCAWLTRLFLAVTGTTTFLTAALRVCGLGMQLAVAAVLFFTFRSNVGKRIAFLLAVLYFSMFPKLTAVPEFSNMLNWFLTVSLCCLYRAYQQKWKRSHVMASAVFLCLAIISYPTALLTAMVYLAGILMLGGKEKWKTVFWFFGTCFVIGCGYLAGILYHTGVGTFLKNLRFILGGDSSHANGLNVNGDSILLSDLLQTAELLVMLAAVILLSRAAAKIITRKQPERYTERFCTIGILGSYLAAMFFILVQKTGFDCVKLFFLLVPLLAIAKGEWTANKKFYVFAIAAGSVVLVSVSLVTNLMLVTNLPFLQVAFWFGMLSLAETVYGDLKRALTGLLLAVLLISLFGITGYTQKYTVIGQNIFQYNTHLIVGPSKWVFCDWCVAYPLKITAPLYDELVQEKESVMMFSYNYYNAASVFYLLKDVKVAQYSTICTPTYEETYQDYWEEFPDRVPDVMVLESADMEKIEKSFAYRYLIEQYTYQKVGENEYYQFWRKCN